MFVATSQEMQNIDRRAGEEFGIPTLLLMENAALGVTRIVEEMYGPVKGEKITVVCGKGNNGGDGLAAARQLHNRGARVQVYLLSEQAALKGDAAVNLDIVLKMGTEVYSSGMYDMQALRIALNHSHVIIDAILGTGLSSPVTGEYGEVIELIHDSRRPVVAVDIPTGINSDTGEIMGRAVKAAATVSFVIPKRGHLLYPGSEFTGRLHVVDISIPRAAIEKESIYLHLLTEEEMRELIPSRPAESHKGSFGHVLVIAGSIGKGGAAAMTSLSCLRTGAGLVTLAIPESVQPIVAEKVTEVMTCPLAETAEKTIALSAMEAILELSRDKEVVAIGPGLTTHKETVEVTRRLIKEIEAPIVIDADAINALAGHLDVLRDRRFPTVLTPHPGEMGRLTGKSAADVQRDRIEIARAFAMAHGVYLILKGAHTVIAEPSGGVHLSPTGNPGMATAGTGDALTGIIAGLIAQKMDISAAVRLGVYLHGLAGDLAAKDIGMVGMIAGDLIARIPAAIRHLSDNM
jgi:NAD(P)H-hydrate epimerase